MTQPNYIHLAGDGCGHRMILVNGIEVNHVVYANEENGVVEFVPYPVRAKRDGNAYTRKLRGKVEVIFLGGFVSSDQKLPIFGERCCEEYR